MTTITMNTEKNGIEIRFDNKPSSEIIDGLKANGFRWSGKQKMWYARQSDERIAFAESIRGNDAGSSVPNNKSEKNSSAEYDLWAMTRTDEIPNNYELYRIHDCKEIAAIIRKHLRSRFPFCKWSVTSDTHSIDSYLMASPWSKDSDEVKAIVKYTEKFRESYNYDNSDSMTDYFDVNFYGSYGCSWEYQQREMTVSEMNMSARFAESKAAWEAAEAERIQREYEERARQREIERKEYERISAEQDAKAAHIEEVAEVADANFAVVGCVDTGYSKCSDIKRYTEDNEREGRRVVCKISRTVTLDRENYKDFCGLLLHDFSFVAGMGGTSTDDARVSSEIDFQHMTKDERETVEFYYVNCVAIYCENELKFVVDPQGYNYCRYVYLVDEQTAIATEYKGSTGISAEDAQKYSELADDLYDVSTTVIQENNLIGSWNNADFGLYEAAMVEWIERNKFPFSIHVVRAIKECEDFKVAMYKVLGNYNSIQAQFERAMMEYGQKFTLIKISDWGGVITSHGKFRSATKCQYAQYENNVKLVYAPEKKRGDYYIHLHGNVLIYDGYVDYPEDLLFEVRHENNGLYNVTTKMSRYGSCDYRQLDDIMNYFAAQGIRPIINTYKPEF